MKLGIDKRALVPKKSLGNTTCTFVNKQNFEVSFLILRLSQSLLKTVNTTINCNLYYTSHTYGTENLMHQLDYKIYNEDRSAGDASIEK